MTSYMDRKLGAEQILLQSYKQQLTIQLTGILVKIELSNKKQ